MLAMRAEEGARDAAPSGGGRRVGADAAGRALHGLDMEMLRLHGSSGTRGPAAGGAGRRASGIERAATDPSGRK